MNDKQFKQLKKSIEKATKKTPEQYYQATSLKKCLIDPKGAVNLIVSNRRDGKSYTITKVLSQLMLDGHLRVLYLATDERSRVSYFNQMLKVFREHNEWREELLEYRNIQRWYLNIYYAGEHIATIIDFSEIESLKNESAFLSQFSIIFYDEFLKSPYRYWRDEYQLVKILMKSITRENPQRLFTQPKLILAANPINFDSPILTGFDVLDRLEVMKINSVEVIERGSVRLYLEKNKNDFSNVSEEDDLFPDESDDANSAGDFIFNNYNLTKKVNHLNHGVVDLGESYLHVYFSDDLKQVVCEIKTLADKVHATLNRATEDADVLYLNKTYFNAHSRQFDRMTLKYVNSYSKGVITADPVLTRLKWYKLLSLLKKSVSVSSVSTDDVIYNDKLKVSHLKNNLLKQFNIEIF